MESELVDASESELKPRDLFHDYLFVSRDQTTKAFDEANRDHLTDAIGAIGQILSMHVILAAKGAHILGLRLDAFALSRTALETLVSALHLARQRASIEVACLLRSALESGCTALHISKDATAYESFLRHTYHSTKSINAAKKEISVIGELWGALSQGAVHVTRRGHGPELECDERDGKLVANVNFHFGVRAPKHIQDEMALALISLTAEIIARTQELSLLDEDPAHPGWRRVPGTSMIYRSGTDAAITKRHRHLLSLMDRVRSSQSK
jgi:hypothetical protein